MYRLIPLYVVNIVDYISMANRYTTYVHNKTDLNQTMCCDQLLSANALDLCMYVCVIQTHTKV